MKAIERLEELLNDKDELIEKLEEELAKDVEWTRHRQVPKGDDAPKLPVPRLQLRYVSDNGDDWYSFRIVYELVYQHFLKGVGDGLDLVAIPFGATKVSGSGFGKCAYPTETGTTRLYSPFRESCHIQSDSQQMNLPMFAICGNHVEKLEPRSKLKERP